MSLTCAAGLAIPLHNLRRLTTGDQAYAIYRGNAATCGVCVQRQACTHRSDAGYRREFGVPIAADLLGQREEILAFVRARRKGLLVPEHVQAVQQATAPHAASRPPIAPRVATPTPKPRAPTRPPRLLPFAPPTPGPWQPDLPQLYMPALVAAWRDHVGRMALEVEVIEPAAPPPHRPWVRENAARRQCRRQTWAERRAYNTTEAKVKVSRILYD